MCTEGFGYAERRGEDIVQHRPRLSASENGWAWNGSGSGAVSGCKVNTSVGGSGVSLEDPQDTIEIDGAFWTTTEC